MGGLFDNGGDGAGRVLGVAMLSVPTLWAVFVINFLALGLIWAYVLRSYPAFEAARFWTGSAFAGAGGATVAMLRFAMDLIAAAVGRRHHADFRRLPRRDGHQAVLRRAGIVARPRSIIGLSFAGMGFFIVGYDSMPMRILIYSLGQSVPLALTLKLLLSRQDDRENPGARLAGIVAIVIIALYAARSRGRHAACSAAISRSSSPTRCSGCWC